MDHTFTFHVLEKRSVPQIIRVKIKITGLIQVVPDICSRIRCHGLSPDPN